MATGVCSSMSVDHLKHGSCFAGPSHVNEVLGFSWKGAWAHTSVLVYIHIVPPLGAFKPQLGGHIVYRCCCILSTSPVIMIVEYNLIYPMYM